MKNYPTITEFKRGMVVQAATDYPVRVVHAFDTGWVSTDKRGYLLGPDAVALCVLDGESVWEGQVRKTYSVKVLAVTSDHVAYIGEQGVFYESNAAFLERYPTLVPPKSPRTLKSVVERVMGDIPLGPIHAQPLTDALIAAGVRLDER